MPQDRTLSSPPRAGTSPDFKRLYRKLERALLAIERSENIPETLELILDALLAGFRDELGFKGGRIYRREGDEYFVCCGFGETHASPFGFQVPPDYPPHRKVLDEGLVMIRRGEPGHDEAVERAMGIASTFAAIAVGRGNRFVIAFSIDGDLREEALLYSLTAVRHVINLKLEQREFTGMLEEARDIQEGVLPRSPPVFAGYDVAGRTRPTAIVGGDFFDYLPLAGSLGVAIGDVSGHGVGAALMARDALTGLRLLAGEGPALAGAVQRLNGVIHRQSLSSKFVSLFYAQLSADGTLAYCNAGHNAPLLGRATSFIELPPGGPVLGPLPAARYEAGQERMRPGDVLALYTDGLVEQESPSGEFFAVERLRAALRDAAGSDAAALVARVLDAVDAHARGMPQRDDQTPVVVRKT